MAPVLRIPLESALTTRQGMGSSRPSLRPSTVTSTGLPAHRSWLAGVCSVKSAFPTNWRLQLLFYFFLFEKHSQPACVCPVTSGTRIMCRVKPAARDGESGSSQQPHRGCKGRSGEGPAAQWEGGGTRLLSCRRLSLQKEVGQRAPARPSQ